MKKIKINEYNSSLGELIDVQDLYSFNKYHHPSSININADSLIINHSKYLDKGKTYYIVCKHGHKSGRVANLLEYYGYNVVQVSYE